MLEQLCPWALPMLKVAVCKGCRTLSLARGPPQFHGAAGATSRTHVARNGALALVSSELDARRALRAASPNEPAAPHVGETFAMLGGCVPA